MTNKRYEAKQGLQEHISDESEDTSQYRYLSFSVGKERYAVKLLQIREVVAVPQTIPVPFTPDYFLGIMNLRGQVISVIDLRVKMGLRGKINYDQTAAMIVDLGSVYVAVIVDAVNNVLELYPEDISEVPKIESSRSVDYITGISRKSGQFNLILNIAQILELEDLSLIQEQLKVA